VGQGFAASDEAGRHRAKSNSQVGGAIALRLGGPGVEELEKGPEETKSIDMDIGA
jgi:hypothetical protein